MTVIEMVIFAALLAGFNIGGGLLVSYIIMNLMTNEKFVMKYYKKVTKFTENIMKMMEEEFEKEWGQK